MVGCWNPIYLLQEVDLISDDDDDDGGDAGGGLGLCGIFIENRRKHTDESCPVRSVPLVCLQ